MIAANDMPVGTQATISHRLHLGETDASGYPYFGAFFNWMNHAECELYRVLGHSVTDLITGRPTMPVVHAECAYLQALELDEELTTTAIAEEVGRSTFVARYEIRRSDGSLAGRGRTVSVAVGDRGTEPVPDWLRAAELHPLPVDEVESRLHHVVRLLRSLEGMADLPGLSWPDISRLAEDLDAAVRSGQESHPR